MPFSLERIGGFVEEAVVGGDHAPLRAVHEHTHAAEVGLEFVAQRADEVGADEAEFAAQDFGMDGVVDELARRHIFDDVLSREYKAGQGYEGAMIKAPEGKYKYGRSSVKEGLLLKLKLFKDEEFKIVGFECKYHNANEAKTNELGRTARSTSKEGMIPVDTLGVLYLSTKDGVEFGCGSGFDDATRKELWEQRESLVGKYATVKYFDQGGYDVPRFPIFKGIRNEMDFKE